MLVWMVLILEHNHISVIRRNPIESCHFGMKNLPLVGLWTWNIFTIYPVYMEVCYDSRAVMLAWMVLILEYKHIWVILRNPIENWLCGMKSLPLVGLWIWNIFTMYPVYIGVCYHSRALMLAWMVWILECKHIWVILRNPIESWHCEMKNVPLIYL